MYLDIRWIYLHDALGCLIPDVIHDVGHRVPGETGGGVEQVDYIMNGEGGI